MPKLIIYASAVSYRDGSADAVIEWEPRAQALTVLELLREHGITLSAPCGGRGRCGRCAVWLDGDAEPSVGGEDAVLRKNPLPGDPPGGAFRLRLACAARPLGDCALCFTPYNSPFVGIADPGTYLSGNAAESKTAGYPPVENNAAFPHVSTGSPHSSEHNPVENNSSFPHLLTSYAQNVYDKPGISGLCNAPGDKENKPRGFAFDLGTTTVSLRACSDSGDVIYEKTELNDQRAFGSDVISRISYAGGQGKLETLRNAAASQLIGMLREARDTLGVSYNDIGYVPVAGNTTMQYLLCGVDPSELGRYPYIPSERFGRTETITSGDKSFTAYLPRCTGGFTGGDLTCCLTAVEAARGAYTETNVSVMDTGCSAIFRVRSALPGDIDKYGLLMLCDLGTNGEIALFSGGEILVTSAAAGPALEGGNISCGSGAVPGAISHIYRIPGRGRLRLGCGVVGGCEPASLSGCALLELTAILLDEGVIDGTGRMEREVFDIRDNISITQADIRQLQLAKGAVRAAAERLLELVGVRSPDAIIITGGLGYRVDPYAVRRTGLLPVCNEIFFTPALAMEGAALCLGAKGRELSEKTAARCRVAELSGDDRFDGLFIEHMEFPDNT